LIFSVDNVGISPYRDPKKERLAGFQIGAEAQRAQRLGEKSSCPAKNIESVWFGKIGTGKLEAT
jgi:hypothetical protein